MSDGQFLILIGTLWTLIAAVYYTGHAEEAWAWHIPSAIGGVCTGIGIAFVVAS